MALMPLLVASGRSSNANVVKAPETVDLEPAQCIAALIHIAKRYSRYTKILFLFPGKNPEPLPSPEEGRVPT